MRIRLCDDVLEGILGCASRKELSQVGITGRRFCQIVDWRFPAKPFLVFPMEFHFEKYASHFEIVECSEEFEYSDSDLLSGFSITRPDRKNEGFFEFILFTFEAEIPFVPKYLRFNTVELEFGYRKSIDEQCQMLQPVLEQLRSAFTGSTFMFSGRIEQKQDSSRFAYNQYDRVRQNRFFYFTDANEVLTLLGGELFSVIIDRSAELKFKIGFGSDESSAMQFLASILRVPQIERCARVSLDLGYPSRHTQHFLSADAIANWLHHQPTTNIWKHRHLTIEMARGFENNSNIIESLKETFRTSHSTRRSFTLALTEPTKGEADATRETIVNNCTSEELSVRRGFVDYSCDRRNLAIIKRQMKRVCSLERGEIYAFATYDYRHLIAKFDIGADRWTRVSFQDAIVKRSGIELAVHKGKLFMLGGMESCEDTNQCCMIDLERGDKTEIPPMCTPREAHSSVTIDDFIYVFGGRRYTGYRKFVSLNTVECYSAEVASAWTVQPAMREARIIPAAVAYERVAYVIGGYDGTRDLNTMERFDPRIGSWCNVAPMPTHRASLAASIFDGKIYAAGGFNGNSALRIVEIYDPRADGWMIGQPMNYTRCDFGLVSDGSRLLAIGGSGRLKLEGKSQPLNSVETIEPKQNDDGRSWKMGVEMPKDLAGSVRAIAL